MNESALKDRIKIIAKEKGITFNEVWKQLLLERFLARMSHSAHHDKFIFKGGMLLAQYISIGRETIDVDFLMTKLKCEASSIEKSLKDVLDEAIADGFIFKWSGIEELSQPHMEYPGFRVSFDVIFGKMRDTIHVDIGIGDSVEPQEKLIRAFEYKGIPVFEGEITLLTYPVETIFSEKLETIISKGSINSRMKDYHDVVLMIRTQALFDLNKLRRSISETFHRRGTTFRMPIAYDASGMVVLQRLWKNHIHGLGMFRQKLAMPDSIDDVLEEINAWMSTHIQDMRG